MVDAALPVGAGGVRPDPRSTTRGTLLVLLGASMFIVNAGVSRVALSTGGVAAETLAAVRSAGAATVLLVVVVLAGRVRSLRVGRQHWPRLLLYGIVGVGLLQWLYFVAIERLPVGIALLLEYTAPVLIALWARFVRHERVRARIWPALGMSLLGLALIAQVWQGAVLDTIGVLAGLGAAVSFACYFLVGEHLVNRTSLAGVTFWGFAVSTAFWSVLTPWWQLSGIGQPVDLSGALSGATVPLWVVLGWIIVLGTVLPFGVETLALRDIPATLVSLIAMAEPVGASALAWVWFGEVLAPVQILGGLVVVAGIVLAQTARGSPPAVTAARSPTSR